jgi:acetyl esterase/lipase
MQQVEICSQGFSSKAWLQQCNSTLVCASAGIDDLCSAIVNTKKLVNAYEIGDLALTVAALERSVFDYAKRIRVQNKKPSDEDVRTKLLWRHPGAVMSLLGLLTDCMEQLGGVLRDVQRQQSFVGFVRVYWKFVMGGGIGVGWLLRGKNVRVKLGYFAVGAMVVHRICLRKKFQRLKHLHAQFSILLRFWQICMSEISSNLESEEGSSPKALKRYIPVPISKWMLDLAGVGTIWYDYMYDMNRDLWFLWYTYSILYSSVRLWYSIGGNTMKWYGFPFAFFSAFYYALRPRLAASTASELLSSLYLNRDRRGSNGYSFSRSRNVRLGQIKAAWSTYDLLISEWKGKWGWIWSKFVSYRFVKNLMSKWSWWPFRWMAFYSVSVLGFSPRRLSFKNLIPQEIFETSSCYQYMSVIGTKSLRKAKQERLDSDYNPVLMFIHGGGWVANFLNSDLSFLSEWAHLSDIPIVLFDYSLNTASSFSYSDALKQSALAYDSICNGILGFSPTKVILAGDSVGAKIAISLCAELISTQNHHHLPDSLILAYPPLNLSQVSSPSRAIFMLDPILPMSLLHHPKPLDPSTDDSFSKPLDLDDTLLSQFPETSILVGSIDPFIDDSVEFAHRLSSLGVTCRFKISKGLPHGFLCFGTMLPRIQSELHQMAHWILP